MARDDPVRSAESTSLDERFPGLEALSTEPTNAEMADCPGSRLVTPREDHYVRNHYPTPDLDPANHAISVTGAVENGGDLSPADLREAFPARSVAHTMECSGNGRAYFSPDEDPYCRSIPMEKLREDCLLAYEMNGLPLTPEHGAPVRLLVPGWFGNNSVKWVDRLHVMDSMVTGETLSPGHARYQQESYRILPEEEEPTYREGVDALDTHAQLEADGIGDAYLFDQLPKSLIAAPEDGAALTPGPVDVVGVAWSGEDPVERVEVATDGGGRTQPARVGTPDGDTGSPGETYPWNRKGYRNNAYRSYDVRVTVAGNDR